MRFQAYPYSIHALARVSLRFHMFPPALMRCRNCLRAVTSFHPNPHATRWAHAFSRVPTGFPTFPFTFYDRAEVHTVIHAFRRFLMHNRAFRNESMRFVAFPHFAKNSHHFQPVSIFFTSFPKLLRAPAIFGALTRASSRIDAILWDCKPFFTFFSRLLKVLQVSNSSDALP